MSLVDDAPHPTDIALQELGADRPDADQNQHDERPEPQPESDRTPDDNEAADGDIEMAPVSTAEPDTPASPAEDPAATDSGKENIKEEKENGHSARDAGGVKKILKSGVFGGQCATRKRCVGRAARRPSVRKHAFSILFTP